MYFSKNLTGRSALAKRGVELLVRRYASFAVLLMMLLFAGCEEEPEIENTGFILEGEWIGNGDSYTITKTTVNYSTDDSEWEGVVYPGMELKGDIEKSVIFSDNANAGVLIIKITMATNGNTVDKYTGVYYMEGKKTSIKMANPIGPAPTYTPLEADSLSAAASLFSVDNVGDHVSYWGVYTKK